MLMIMMYYTTSTFTTTFIAIEMLLLLYDVDKGGAGWINVGVVGVFDKLPIGDDILPLCPM